MTFSTCSIYFILVKLFSSLSISAFGGGNTILPTLEQVAVGKYHWLTSAQFVDCFSLSKAGPGPTTLIVELIGIKATGFCGNRFLVHAALIGALISIFSIFVPSSILLLVAAHFWEKWRGMPWQVAIEKALMPITCGLVLAATYTVAKTAIADWITGVMAFSALMLLLYTKLNPVLIMVIAGMVSWLVIR
ncbi:MAG: chromate transporter [Verrucomicrobiae bacterium]|nr:chromate transporter [Verrucomicrobiae bacterium]